MILILSIDDNWINCEVTKRESITASNIQHKKVTTLKHQKQKNISGLMMSLQSNPSGSNCMKKLAASRPQLILLRVKCLGKQPTLRQYDSGLWLELPQPENLANTCVQHRETLDSCFDFIRSDLQCIRWSPPGDLTNIISLLKKENVQDSGYNLNSSTIDPCIFCIFKVQASMKCQFRDSC